MALLITATLPAQVFAASVPEYISEVKIGMGKDGNAAKAALSVNSGSRSTLRRAMSCRRFSLLR